MSTATKERPIIFSPDMVRAILDGRKTETRRVMKFPDGTDEFWYEEDRPWLLGFGGGEYPDVSDGLIQVHDAPVLRSCPYGAPGDVLWVRETWRPWSWHEGMPTVVEFKAGGPRHECHATRMEDEDRIIEWEQRVWLSVEDELDEAGIEPDENGVYHWDESPLRWRPSIHMPRWACRLRLKVEDVRVERVQEIDEEEVFAEGVQIPVSPEGRVLTKIAGKGSPVPYMPEGMLREAHNGGRPDNFQYHFIRAHFAALWDEINAGRGFPWEENPWVWVVKFQPTEET